MNDWTVLLLGQIAFDTFTEDSCYVGVEYQMNGSIIRWMQCILTGWNLDDGRDGQMISDGQRSYWKDGWMDGWKDGQREGWMDDGGWNIGKMGGWNI